MEKIDIPIQLCRICKNKKSPDEFRPTRTECKWCERKYGRLHKRAKKVGSYSPKPIKAEWVE